MNWLFGMVAIIQAFFYWLIKPLVVLSTPLFEVRGIFIVGIILFLWIFSGSKNDEDSIL